MQDNIYQPPTNTGPTTSIPQGFGTYNLDRALNTGFEAFKKEIGFGVGFTILFALTVIGAVLTCFGIIFLVPHISASVTIVGLAIVRGNPQMNTMFKGFSAYGSVLIAAVILFLVHQIILLVLSGPNYALLLSGFDFSKFSEAPDKAFEELGAHMQAAQGSFGPLRILTTALAYVYYPISIYISGRMMLVYPLIIERKYFAIDALKTSWAVTKPIQWHMTLLMLITGLLSGFGILVCCIGMLFTFPLAIAIQGAAIAQLFGEDTESGSQGQTQPAAPSPAPPTY